MKLAASLLDCIWPYKKGAYRIKAAAVVLCCSGHNRMKIRTRKLLLFRKRCTEAPPSNMNHTVTAQLERQAPRTCLYADFAGFEALVFSRRLKKHIRAFFAKVHEKNHNKFPNATLLLKNCEDLLRLPKEHLLITCSK